MKTKIFMLAAATALTFATTSCSDFLDEENKIGESAENTYTTKTGINGLLANCYTFARGFYGKEAALGLSEGGTDLFYYGFDNKQKGLNAYNFTADVVSLTQNNPCFDQYWTLFYQAIDVCNNLLKYSETEGLLTDKEKNQYQAEAQFMRALYNFHLVNMWGDVPYNDKVITGQEMNPTRTPQQEVYGKILADLDESIEKFDAADYKIKTEGRANYWAARAMKARVLLYAASWLGDQLGLKVESNDKYSSLSPTQLYALAESEADAVINSNYASFYDSYEDVWCMDNEAYSDNKEAIFGINYSSDLSTTSNCIPLRTNGNSYNDLVTRTGQTRGGNAMLLMFVSKWNNGCSDLGANVSKATQSNGIFERATASVHAITSASTGKQVDVLNQYAQYGRGFCRYLPSLHLWQLLTEHAATDQRTSVTLLDHYDIADASLAGNQSNYPNLKDTAIYYSVLDGNSAQGKALQAWAKGRYRIQFAYNGDIPVYTSGDPATALPTETAKSVSDVYGDKRYNNVAIGGWESYPGIRKFLDFYKNKTLGRSYWLSWGTSDISSRDAMVMRLPELYLIKAEAQLAQNKSSEALATINILRSKRAIAGTDNTLSSISLDKILDERAIELCGENQRWFDLKRTGKLYEYVAKYNAQCSPSLNADTSKHFLYRPIPQDQIDAVNNYTDSIGAPNGFWQNPGYGTTE